ncbi:GNAT family N-acetyltransferase [Acinetobacter sp. YH12049]|uniref:GNAT family N-acetyltransferase n=1 Tax=Acinetobacter sp. YH12049 TaxID=2601054 RepID=UPI00211DBD7B|nr:GNAT family N-acetyltransferase [Acinetobacter sp. YH12049]
MYLNSVKSYKKKDFHLYVMESENTQIKGCIGIQMQGMSCEIGHFAIHPNEQAQGLGKKLLQFAEQQAMLIEPNVEEFVMYVIDRKRPLNPMPIF